MGLFKKGGNASAAPAQDFTKSFGHAAFDPADVEDARRGHPLDSLEAFATASGLEYRNREQAGAFVSTLPTWPDYIFNLCRGVFPSGRLGQLAHELLELEAHNGSIRVSGQYYDVRVTTRTSLREMSGLGVDDPANQPFAGNAVWIPTTTVHVRAPEVNRLGVFKIARSTSLTGKGDKELERAGLAGYSAVRGDKSALAAVAQACRPYLATRLDPYVSLQIRYGLVALTVNGYRSDNTDLHNLIVATDGIATALSALTPQALATPFTNLGPPAGTVPNVPGVPLPHPSYTPAYARKATELGFHNEDISHLMALFPRCPIPGIPSGVLVGNLPGTSSPCRLVWFEQGGRTSGSVRGGVIMPAAPSATTALGGELNQQTGMYEEVVDGVVSCWRQQRSFNALETDALVTAATETLRASGLAVL